jgi:hypothetical protein
MVFAQNISLSHLLSGIVIETHAESLTGSVLYSDVRHTAVHGDPNRYDPYNPFRKVPSSSYLNGMAQIPILGIVAGVARVALGAIHTVGHLFAALITQNKGHLWHAAKGGCEMIRGVIEAIPLIGRIFAGTYGISWNPDQFPFPSWCETRFCWWMIKMYNPEKPDALDSFVNNWNAFPRSHYIKA